MPNSIALFKKYVDLLDEVYQKASVSSVLDGDSSLVRAGTNANEISIPKISMDGLADYSRASGYVAGDVTLEFETVTFNYDRGRTFTVDAMDDEETVGLAFGKLSSEFMRTKVAPEIDAFRFALYAGLDDISAATPAALTTGDAWLAALSVAKTQMDEDEVPENRILFINPTGYQLIQNVETYKSKSAFESFSQVIKVPKRRFNTAINLRDGTSENEDIGGYQLTGNDINFIDWNSFIWSTDTFYEGGDLLRSAAPVAQASPTLYDAALYQTARSGKAIRYSIPAPPGLYAVHLKFAELWLTEAGKRPMRIIVNGRVVRDEWDPAEAAGQIGMSADIRTENVAPDKDGRIAIAVEARGANDAILQGIEIE